MRNTIYKGNYMSVSEETIGGHVYERVTMRAGVNVIPLKENKVLLINEKRTHENIPRWKVVSGWCDKEGKSERAHAQEELAEEANMQAERWEEVHRSVVPSATVNPNSYYFTCEDVSELPYEQENPDTCIVLEKKWFTFEEVFELLNTKEAWLDHSMMVVLWVLYNKKNER